MSASGTPVVGNLVGAVIVGTDSTVVVCAATEQMQTITVHNEYFIAKASEFT
jgi:hypothetical protein